jgi:inorganic triphosphatase YgiF
MDGVEEREVKLSVPLGFAMPSPARLLDGVTVADHGDTILDAVYWDTDDLALACAGVGLRHRNGTWTFKGRSRREGDSVVREELEIEAGGEQPPPRVCDRLRDVVDVSMLHPVARLRTARRRIDVSDSTQMAELVHDRVSVRDGEREVLRFEEVEVEHPAAGAALADRLVAVLVRLGATVETTPKYVRALRALGHQPPAVDG